MSETTRDLEAGWKSILRAGAGMLAAIFELGAETRSARAEPIAYTVATLATPSGAAAETSWFCRIDLATGVMTPIARVINPENPAQFLNLVEALDFDPLTGKLWAVTGGERLIELNPVTGQAVGAVKVLTDAATGITLNKVGYGLALRPTTGPQYISAGTSGRFFGTVDLATGLVNQILSGTPAAAANAIAVNAAGEVYGAETTSPLTEVHLISINPLTGGFSVLPTIAGVLNRNVGLDFDSSGQLWGIDEAGNPSTATATVYRIDTATGARSGIVTPTDPVSGQKLRADNLAIAPAAAGVPALPELAVVVLVLLLASVAIAQSRRRVRVTRR